jgi:hypothetical protein
MSAASIGVDVRPARLWASIARTLRFRRMEISRRIARLKAEDEKLSRVNVGRRRSARAVASSR